MGAQKDPRCTYICKECNKGFHPECFNLWHQPECIKEEKKDLFEQVMALKTQQIEQRKATRVDTAVKKSMPLLTEAEFPCEKVPKKKRKL